MSKVIEQVQHINLFFEALYQTPHRLSDILRDTGLSEQELQQLRSSALEPYLVELLQRWRAILPSLFHNQRRADILIRFYGLDGAPPLTLQQKNHQLTFWAFLALFDLPRGSLAST